MSNSAWVGWDVFVLICCFLVSPASFAAKIDCQQPVAPELLSQISYYLEAQALGNAVDVYAEECETYLPFIAAFADAGSDSPTAAESSALKTRYTDYLTAVVAHKVGWKDTYGASRTAVKSDLPFPCPSPTIERSP